MSGCRTNEWWNNTQNDILNRLHLESESNVILIANRLCKSHFLFKFIFSKYCIPLCYLVLTHICMYRRQTNWNQPGPKWYYIGASSKLLQNSAQYLYKLYTFTLIFKFQLELKSCKHSLNVMSNSNFCIFDNFEWKHQYK